MLDKIIKSFFIRTVKAKEVKCITLVSDYRDIKFKKENILKKQTCLSGYFKNNKGLNYVERAKFNQIVI